MSMCYYMQHIENFQYIFLINKRQCKKAILPSTLPFPLCNAHKLYFDVVSKLLPYVALAFPLFFYYFFSPESSSFCSLAMNWFS